MRTTPDLIWFKKDRHTIEGRIEFSKEVPCLDAAKISFRQELKIRESIKAEIMASMYGQMPGTCMTVMRHIRKVEEELSERGDVKLAAKLASAIALVSSIREQMVVPRPVVSDDET